jgi:hypothetical protein
MTRASKHAERERIAQWMIANSLATGHGDTIEDLLGEAAGQIKELHKKNAELVAALKEASFWLKTCGHWDVAKRSDDAAAAAGHTQV